MIWEKDYKELVLSNELEKRFPLFWEVLIEALVKANIDYQITKVFSDVWLRDYLGIPVSKNKIVSFKYAPSYMKDLSKLSLLQEEKNKFEEKNTTHSHLIVDGGNCVFNNKYVILCERIYKENSKLSNSTINKELKLQFQGRKLIIIPDLKNDEFGHADGLVRFYDQDSVFVLDMRNSYSRRLIKQLEKIGLNIIKLPYYNNYKVTGNELSAKGYYINYLRLGNKIILPQFDVKEDNEALKIMVKHFGTKNIFPINCNAIATQGGILNCCSWTY